MTQRSNIVYSDKIKYCTLHLSCGYIYNQYIKSEIRTEYLDEDGTGVKPKQPFTKYYKGRMSWYGINQYSSIGEIWGRNMKRPRQNFGRKRKPTKYMFLPGSQSCKAEGHLKLRSCFHNAIIKSSPRIVKYTNKHKLYG